MIDRPAAEDQPEGKVVILLNNVGFTSHSSTTRNHNMKQETWYRSDNQIPRVGEAAKLKVQEAIPPFSLIEDSIQGRRPETLVKTA